MLNGLVYVLGLVTGGGWRSMFPRPTDLRDAMRMFRYYTGIPLAKLTWRILVPHSTQLENERVATGTPESEAGVRVVRRHHLLVRCSHLLKVPILLASS